MLPFQVTEGDIGRLDEHEFAEILNKLLQTEAAHQGIPHSHVYTTDRIHDPDEGIDALVDGVPPGSGEWLPEGRSIWQFKSGDVDNQDIRNELQKDAVIKEITNSATYCLCLGRGYPPAVLLNRERTIEEQFVSLGLTPKYAVLPSTRIATWVSSHPEIAQLQYFGKPYGGLWVFKDLERQGSHEIPFVPDEPREQILRSLQESLRQSLKTPLFRIEGQPGVGKTRLLLEALRHEDFKGRVLYAQTPEQIPSGLFSFVAHSHSVHLILVIEGCTVDQHRNIRGEVGRCDGRLKVITSGSLSAYTESLEERLAYRLEPLDDKAIETIIFQNFPVIPRVRVPLLAHLAGGYPRLAVFMAENIARRPELASAGDLLRTGEVKEEVLRLISLGIEERRALQAVSLLTRVGWERELESEGLAIAQLFDVSWPTLQIQVQELVNLGLVILQGRYRNVTPYLLAIFMAQDVWDALGGNTLQLMDMLPNESSREAFFERIADLGPHKSTKSAIEQFLKDSGLFQNIEALLTSNNAKLLMYASHSAPEAAISALQEIIEPLNLDELRQHITRRHEIVWTLRSLAWWKETFFEATRLLLRLAEAEGRPFHGVATETWKTLFQLELGGTEVPAQERFRIIEEALASTSVEQCLLAVKALESALSKQVSRSGGSEVQGGRIIREEWRPKTYFDLWNAQRAALALLDRAMGSTSKEVVSEANSVFVHSAYGLVRGGLHEDIIERLISAEPTDDEHHLRIRNSIERILSDEKIPLDEILRERLQEKKEGLSERDFPTRLRRWVGELSFQDRHENLKSDHRLREMEITALAEEAIGEPGLLGDELDWLASEEARGAFSFGRTLGRLDEQRVWLEDIVDRARAGFGFNLLSGYLLGRADAGEVEWREQVLDQWAGDENELAEAVFTATHYGLPSDHAAQRLTLLVDKGWISHLQLGHLIYGRWTEGISFGAFLKVLNRLIIDESVEGTERSLELIRSRLDAHNEEELLEELVWELLERPVPFGHGVHSIAHDWVIIAYKYVERNPVRVAKAILSPFERNEHFLLGEGDSIGQLFQKATELAPKEVWDVVGEYLLGKDSVSGNLEFELKYWYVCLLDHNLLSTWADSNLPDGPEILAQLVPLGEDDLNPLARSLLVKYGPEGRVPDILVSKPFYEPFSVTRSKTLEDWLEKVNRWASDPEHNVRTWAERLRDSLQREIQREKEIEAEDRW